MYIRNNPNLFIRFKQIGNNVFVYNSLNPEENRVYLPIISINGEDPTTNLKKHESKLLYDENDIIIICDINGIAKQINPNNQLENNQYYKDFTKNEFVDISYETQTEKTSNNPNEHIDYAVSSIKSLLLQLKSNIKSPADQTFLEDLLSNFNSVTDTYINPNKNVDIALLSTAILLLDNEIKNISDELATELSYDLYKWNVTNPEENTSFITDGKKNYKLLVKQIRDCIAHSNYQVSSDGHIQFYNYGGPGNTKNFDIEMDIETLKKIINTIYKTNYLNNIFPITEYFGDKYYGVNQNITKENMSDYLDNILLLDVDNLKLKSGFTNINFSARELKGIALEMSMRMSHNDKQKKLNQLKRFRVFYKNKIQNLLQNQNQLIDRPLNDEEKNKVLQEIQRMGEDHFYSLGIKAQSEVINKIIKSFRKGKKHYVENIIDMTSQDHFSSKYYEQNSSNYIEQKNHLETMIISLLNVLMLYCYNKNRINRATPCINVSDVNFDNQIYEDLLKTKINKFYSQSSSLAEEEKAYITLIQKSTVSLNPDFLRKTEKTLKQTSNSLIKLRHDIENIDAVIALSPDANKEKVDLEILNRIRDSIAHGRVNIIMPNNQLLDAELEIVDEYEGIEEFNTRITLKELLQTLNKITYIDSITKENYHFKNPGL